MNERHEKSETKTETRTEAKSEIKPAISDAAMAAAVKFVSEQMIPAAVAAAVSATTKQAAPAPAPTRAGPVPQQKCHDCGQVRSGCEGKHVLLAVYPQRYPQHADYFPGVILNGVKYLSNNGSHKILVPANAESTILGVVAGFEQNEHEMANGRKAERHSGHVSPHGASVQPANQAWR